MASKDALFWGISAVEKYFVDGLPDFLSNQTRKEWTLNEVHDLYIQTPNVQMVSDFWIIATRYQNVTNDGAGKDIWPYDISNDMSETIDPVPSTFRDEAYIFNVQPLDPNKARIDVPIPNNNELVYYESHETFHIAVFPSKPAERGNIPVYMP